MEKSMYTREQFTHQNEVRWCPGCGDYAILSALQRILPELGRPPEQHVFVSGIGCAGRLPYYLNTYGFHTIHGRAPTIATGLKAMRDDLCVWIITGDGDALSIGGNHLLHTLRRNLNVNILLLNNQVYGLTKGQFSPTSPQGQVTKTSPEGASHHPLNPMLFALGAGATFVARAVDKDPAHLGRMIQAAYAHEGTSLIEIYQDCHIFNNGAFDAFSLKNHRRDHTIVLEEGAPLVFGEGGQTGLRWVDHHWEKTEDQALIDTHEPAHLDAAYRLAMLTYPAFPVPLGIYYQTQRPVFSLPVTHQKRVEDLALLYRSKASWQVSE